MNHATSLSILAKANSLRFVESWMHLKAHVQIEMGGARDNTLHRPKPDGDDDKLFTLDCNSLKSLLRIKIYANTS